MSSSFQPASRTFPSSGVTATSPGIMASNTGATSNGTAGMAPTAASPNAAVTPTGATSSTTPAQMTSPVAAHSPSSSSTGPRPEAPTNEIKIGKSETLRPVFLRQIMRQLIEGEEIVRISGLATAIQETVIIHQLLSNMIETHSIETHFLGTHRSKKDEHPQLRIAFSRTERLKIPLLLRPDNVIFMEKPKAFTPIYDEFRHESANGSIKSPPSSPSRGGNGDKGGCKKKKQEFEQHFGSMNAGSDQLFVGGSAINAAFRRALSAAGFNCDAFKAVHEELWEKASQNCDRVVTADEAQRKRLGVNYLSCRASLSDVTTCACFIHIFPVGKRPMGSNQNAAMLYLIGPRGSDCASAADFVSKLRLCGKNAVVSVNQYNLKQQNNYTEELPRIDRVRVCLVSGGIYKHPDVSKHEIAEAIMQGLFLNPSAQYEHSPQWEFAYDEDVFREAFATMWTEKSLLKHVRSAKEGDMSVLLSQEDYYTHIDEEHNHASDAFDVDEHPAHGAREDERHDASNNLVEISEAEIFRAETARANTNTMD
ncbi:unnamed protein product [Amoebophrya sp. A25]|nr:unnamed protein product [Amoebophrya sp. A25]|eukprot:GSA25T00020574001.1